jgi:sulfatase maturation enzyme AslB (radical SAM superfamily)
MGKWPVGQKDVNYIQLEICNYCNLACPFCPRQPRINNHNEIMNNTLLDVDLFKSIFKFGEWPKLTSVMFCGNVDEPTTHPGLEEMMSHLLAMNDKLIITISTNGSTRNEKYYTTLGQMSAESNQRIRIRFAIDGLEDTNHIYRVGSNWQKIETNYRAYIAAGGYAIWQFVVFEHNKHQIEEVKSLHLKEGFRGLLLRYSNRNTSGSSIVGIDTDYSMFDKVVCKALKQKTRSVAELFINHLGDLTPCCFIDLSDPKIRNQYKDILDSFESNIPYNLYKNTIEGIMSGPWFDWLFDNFQTNSICIDHCKLNNNDRLIAVNN